MIVRDEKYRGAECINSVMFDKRSENRECHCVAIIVNSPAASATRCVSLSRIAAITDCPVVGEEAIDDNPRHTDAADTTAVGSNVPVSFSTAKSAVDDVHRIVVVLIEYSHSTTTYVLSCVCANILEKPAIDNLELASAYPNRSATIVFGLVFRIPAGEDQVLMRTLSLRVSFSDLSVCFCD